MANENQGGGNPPPDADALRAQGYQAAVAYIGEVNDLCDLAGQRDKARAFIDAAKPIADIRRELVTAKASASENTTIHGQHDGSAPSAGTTPKPRLSAAQAMAKQLGLKGG